MKFENFPLTSDNKLDSIARSLAFDIRRHTRIITARSSRYTLQHQTLVAHYHANGDVLDDFVALQTAPRSFKTHKNVLSSSSSRHHLPPIQQVKHKKGFFLLATSLSIMCKFYITAVAWANNKRHRFQLFSSP